jgi:hypothetical protein
VSRSVKQDSTAVHGQWLCVLTTDPEDTSSAKNDVMHVPPTRSEALDKSALPIVISKPLTDITASREEVVHDASFCHAINT